MTQAAKIKASDRQKVCSQLMATLKKEYKIKADKPKPTVLEDILYSVCLENSSADSADAAYEKMLKSFYDLNELRVSSIQEIRQSLGDLHQAEAKAMRIKDVLHHVFELEYSFDWESLRKAKIEQAETSLKAIPSLTPFVIGYCMMSALGNHAAPLDDEMCQSAIWFGLIPEDSTPAVGSELFKSAIKKAECPVFVGQWRMLSLDSRFTELFKNQLADEQADPFDAPAMLKNVLAGKVKPAKAKVETKSAAASKTTSETKKTTKKKVAKKVTAAKPETKVAKKTASKETTAKKPAKSATTKKSSKKSTKK